MSVCSGCTRRTLLHGIGLALAGCRISLDDAPVEGNNTAVDAAPPDSNEPPVPCLGGKICIDITRPSSGTLGQVGGTHKVSAGGDVIIIVRSATTEFETLSALCTHQRCPVTVNLGTRLRCPCHGSVFSFEGAVLRGPASAPLKVYANAFDPATNILTITL